MEQAQALNNERLRDLILGTFDGAPAVFRPCAYYDATLDCIRVITRDCSVSEWRVSPRLTVLEDNYADPDAGRELYVGFTVKGARHFCEQQGIDLSVPVNLSALLDKILAESSEDSVRLAVQAVAKPLVQQERSDG